MDEILIEEKRYVSSKQAAKLTGYAKDYVGQLCREGRVPARLVGRSWYVLESAIQDHRFGAPAVSPEEKTATQAEIHTPLATSLETPRYEAASHEEIPSIEDLTASKNVPEGKEEAIGDLQGSWHAWFAQTNVLEDAPLPVEESSDVISGPEITEASETIEDIEVNVPIRAIHHSLYQPAADEMLPPLREQAVIQPSFEPEVAIEDRTRTSNRVQSGVRMVSVLFAAVAVITAMLGSGYFDSYILSNRQISLVAGVSFYNK